MKLLFQRWISCSHTCGELGDAASITQDPMPKTHPASSSGEGVRLSSWVQMLRLSFTLVKVWEQRGKQQESGGSRYWKSCPREALLYLASLSLGRTVNQGPVLGEAVLAPYPMTPPSLLYSMPTIPRDFSSQVKGPPLEMLVHKTGC